MEEIQNLRKLLNPWALHFQKLGLELKCPLCLNLLNKPMMLPCNHIFCDFCVPRSTQFGSECPSCKNHCADREIRSVPYIDNLVTIFRNLDATFGLIMLELLSSEQSPVLVTPPSTDKLKKEPSETPEDEVIIRSKVHSSRINEQGHASHNGCDKDGTFSSRNADKGAMMSNGQNQELKQHGGHRMALNQDNHLILLQSSGWKETNEEHETEIDMNQVLELSPESPPSFGDIKDMDDNSSAPGSRCGSIEKCKNKMSVECLLNTTGGDMHHRTLQGGTAYERDAKRQKMLDYCSSEVSVKHNGLTQEKVYSSDNRAISKCNLSLKSEEHLCVAQATLVSDSYDRSRIACALCHSSKLSGGIGQLLYYANGKEVVGDMTMLSDVIPVHSKCIEWTPRVYYAGETIKNLESELARAAKLKCSSCGQKGAALGCFAKSCRRTYHVPCAFEIQGCRWDCDDFLMLCPNHNSVKFPREKSKPGKSSSGLKHPVSNERIIANSEFWATSPSGPKEWILCGSALSSEEKFILVKFATARGATVAKFWKPTVTHVIASTNEKGACTRTLKVLMGILNGRWILTMDWIKACMEANCPVNEEPYEVSLDNHGCLNGPKTGRLRASNSEPKLFEGLKFYFSGDFVTAYKIDLLDLVRTAGGAIIESREQLMIQSHNAQASTESLVVYNVDPTPMCAIGEESPLLSQRLVEAVNVANGTNSLVVRHTWILESIAACKLLAFGSRC